MEIRGVKHLNNIIFIFTPVSDPKYTHISDHDLLEGFYRDGDTQRLGALLERYTLLVYGLCIRYLRDKEDAKDAAQQIFVQIIKELGKYKVTHFSSWTYNVTRNFCLMKLRERKKLLRVIIYGEDADRPGPHPDEAENEGIKDAEVTFLSQALEELNEPQRICIRLFFMDQQSYQDIAKTTGYSMSEVKSHIQNGKRNLRIIMESKFSRL